MCMHTHKDHVIENYMEIYKHDDWKMEKNILRDIYHAEVFIAGLFVCFVTCSFIVLM